MLLYQKFELLLIQPKSTLQPSGSFTLATVDWAQILTVVIVGLLIALTLQLLLLALGSAIAVSLFPLPKSQSAQASSSPSNTVPIGAIAGLGILSTTNFVLFVASFLSIALVQLPQPASGAIAGLVLWAAYCLMVVWLSFRTINALGGTALNLSTAGLGRIFALLKAIFQAQSDAQLSHDAQVKVAIDKEVQAALNQLQDQLQKVQAFETRQSFNDEKVADSTQRTHTILINQQVQEVWQHIQQYVRDANSKKLSRKSLDRVLQEFMAELPETTPDNSAIVDVQDLIPILATRDDLSETKKTRIFQQVQEAWAEYTPSVEATAIAEALPLQTSSNEPDTHSSGSMPDLAVLQTTLEKFNHQILPLLPSTLQQSWKVFAPLTAIADGSHLEDLIAPLQSVLNSPDLKPQLEQLLEQSQSYLSGLSETVEDQAAELRDRTTTQLSNWQEAIQQGTQSRLNTLRQDLQNRLVTTRKTIAIALWWLVATTLTGGISSALAGAIATGFHPFSSAHL